MRQAPEPSQGLSLPARAAAIAALVGLDRITKLWAVRWLKPKAIVSVCPFFQFVYVENTGMAFGLGRHRNDFFLILSTAL
ncbi:MAG: signal peptidase II, partial [Elusimicrobia bacterium]|nr:signal peptidase II [Elusimicrobiota bacterium]